MQAKTVSLIAPPAPKCFEVRMQWVTFLHSAQAGNKSRPFKDGKYRTEFQFCRDCNEQKAAEMTKQGKCDFKGYQASLTCGTPRESTAAA